MAAMLARIGILTTLLLVVPVVGQEVLDPTCAEVRSCVLPSSVEEAWRTIAWRDALGKAVIEADVESRPVLLWAMNGHPLGLT